MFWIDTSYEWVLLACLVSIVAVVLVPFALSMAVFYLGKAIWHWDINYLVERV